ncbi:MAG TPA: hypothetical protein VF157_01730 [Chloroflexota bacterium]
MASDWGGEPGDPPRCHAPACGREAIVYLGGRPLCGEHYLQNVNELNDLGLTPRSLSEQKTNGKAPQERLIREPVEGPAAEPSNSEPGEHHLP